MSERTLDTIPALVTPYTMTGTASITALTSAVARIIREGIAGDLVECGVWRGGSSLAMALVCEILGDARRWVRLFDTFTGMPTPGNEDRRHDGAHARDLLAAPLGRSARMRLRANASLEEVRRTMALSAHTYVSYCQGKVEDTLPDAAPGRIALLRVDTDWYSSTAHIMAHLVPRVVPGGVVIFDDYGHWLGARQAITEYFERRGGPFPVMEPLDASAVLMRV